MRKSAEIFKIINWLEEMGIENYTINEDLTVDVDGDVSLYNRGLTEIPIQFGKISRWFNICGNQLTSLKGCPKWVGGYFDCEKNQLSSLKGAPEYIESWFDCGSNPLKTLEGFPNEAEEVWIQLDDFHYDNISVTEEDILRICKVNSGIIQV